MPFVGTGETKEQALKNAEEWADGGVEGLAVFPATANLIALVDNKGGQVAYDLINGVACTEDEAED